MPILNVKLCASPSLETSGRVAAALTNLTAEILKKKRELTAVTIEYVQAQNGSSRAAPCPLNLLVRFTSISK